MSGYFVENRKFFGLDGVLGRRDFIINYIVIELIESVFWLTPLIYLTIFHPELSPLLSKNDRPIGFLIFTCIVGLLICGLYFPSIVRRVRDIVAEQDERRIYLISATLTVLLFMSYTPVASLLFARWIVIFIIISLMVMQGKITGEKPKNEVIKFNWGAFFGTWLWGIFNKKPVTLLILPLFLTAGWFPFMIICGLKGNEWAYEISKDKFDTVENFHSNQKTQTILSVFLSPILNFILILSGLLGGGVILHKYSMAHPEFKTQMIDSFKSFQTRATENTFTKIELTQNDYKFYISPKDWTQVSDTMKVSVIKNAQDYVLIKQNKYSADIKDMINSLDVIGKVKIYSSYNNEILGSFELSENEAKAIKDGIEKNDSAQYRKIFLNGYKLNQNPALP